MSSNTKDVCMLACVAVMVIAIITGLVIGVPAEKDANNRAKEIEVRRLEVEIRLQELKTQK